MRTYKIQFGLKSSLRTPFHADTIFGHFCWAMRYIEGEDKLKGWLGGYKESPTLISNAFPVGKFPRPLIPDIRDSGSNDLQRATILKKIKKIDLISEDWIKKYQHSMSVEKLNEELEVAAKEESSTAYISLPITHNTYDRLSGRTLEGSLYDWEETFFLDDKGEPQTFWFYVSTETLTRAQLRTMLDFMSYSGFGADKSIGKGQLEVVSLEESSLPEVSNANAFISLSNFIPSIPEELNGYYRPITKFGKLGGEWASGRVPFKKPVVMLQAGSVVIDPNYSPSKFYGKLQRNIHRQEEIVQYGYAFPFPIYLEEVP